MNEIFGVAIVSAIILTSGVYLTGYIDERQNEKFGYLGSRLLVLSYTFIYGFINVAILANIYIEFIIYDSDGFITLSFIIFSILVCIGIVHTDTENSVIEYLYNISPLKEFFIKIEKREDAE
tara:strand:+ start:6565 stop:6930 length:366 start_codon:yes stop_codon:yes gene_type:complete